MKLDGFYKQKLVDSSEDGRLISQLTFLIASLFFILLSSFNVTFAENVLLKEAQNTSLDDALMGQRVREQGSISVTQIVVGSSADSWLLGTKADIYLGKTQFDALMNGISFDFVYEFEVNAARDYLWDKNIVAQTVRRELSLHSLSNQFIVRDSQNGRLLTFLTLDLALEFISNLENVNLAKVEQLDGQTYSGRLRLYLDIESLPTPMRLPAYIGSDWSLSSGWVSWSVP